MNSLPDAERDAGDVVQALSGLAALLRRSEADLDDETRRVLLALVQHGGEAATRVLTYLRELRGNGDGDAVAVPPRLGPWREWVPARGHVLADHSRSRRIDEVPNRPRRGDPGE